MIGTEVSHYRIESEIGRGGMGIVYKAADTALGRTVALKFLPPSLHADEAAEARFIHEAKSISAIDHPNVAVVHEIGETDQGQLFIAMGYYTGETLEDIIARGPVEIDTAVDYARQIAAGLQCAHEKGITHRDVKPGNVIVTESGLLKILDFGLAKVQDVTMTMADTSLGTPAYSSPEQSRNEPVDHRADLWALGVVFYEMLTGVRPFAGGYASAVIYAVVNEPQKPVHEVRPDVPERISAVVDRLLKKEPTERYQSAADVVADLEQRGVAVVPPSTELEKLNTVVAEVVTDRDQTVRRGRPAPIVLIGSAVAVVAVIALAFQLMSGRGGTTATVGGQNSSRSVREEARMRLDAGISYLNNQQYSLALAELEQSIALDSTYAPAWSSISAAYENIGDHRSAVDAANRSLAIDSTNEGAYYNLGFALSSLGNVDDAIDAFANAARVNPGFTAAYSAWGDLLIEAGRPAEALEVLERGRPNAEQNYRFLIYKNIGKALRAQGKYAESIDALESSLVLQDTWPETMWLLAQSYEDVGRIEDASEMYAKYIQYETDPVLKRRARDSLANL